MPRGDRTDPILHPPQKIQVICPHIAVCSQSLLACPVVSLYAVPLPMYHPDHTIAQLILNRYRNPFRIASEEDDFGIRNEIPIHVEVVSNRYQIDTDPLDPEAIAALHIQSDMRTNLTEVDIELVDQFQNEILELVGCLHDGIGDDSIMGFENTIAMCPMSRSRWLGAGSAQIPYELSMKYSEWVSASETKSR